MAAAIFVLVSLLARAIDWSLQRQAAAAGSCHALPRLPTDRDRAIILAVGLFSALLAIPEVRAVAGGLLASSAVLGVVLGFAAQRTLGNFVAGLLIALAQPVRIGDRVEYDGTPGVVEEIGLTYTFIRTVDRRRIVVPNEKLASDTIVNASIRSRETYAEVSVPVPLSGRPRGRARRVARRRCRRTGRTGLPQLVGRLRDRHGAGGRRRRRGSAAARARASPARSAAAPSTRRLGVSRKRPRRRRLPRGRRRRCPTYTARPFRGRRSARRPGPALHGAGTRRRLEPRLPVRVVSGAVRAPGTGRTRTASRRSSAAADYERWLHCSLSRRHRTACSPRRGLFRPSLCRSAKQRDESPQRTSRARVDLPPFASSAMDGFAVRSGDLPATLRISRRVGRGPALRGAPRVGLRSCHLDRSGRARRARTQSSRSRRVVRSENRVEISHSVEPGAHVRPRGGDVAAGEVVVPAGTTFTPARLAASAAAGVAVVSCGRRPRVSVLATGSELVAPGEQLRPGQIYESERPHARLRACGGRCRGRGGADRCRRRSGPARRARTRACVRCSRHVGRRVGRRARSRSGGRA